MRNQGMAAAIFWSHTLIKISQAASFAPRASFAFGPNPSIFPFCSAPPTAARARPTSLMTPLPSLSTANSAPKRSRGLAILMKKGGDEGGKGLEVGRDRGSSGQKRRDIRVYLGGAGGEGGLTVGTSVMLSDDQNHYLRKVMRVRDGGEVKVFDGVSGEFWCELESQGTGLITERRREVGAEKLVDVWVLVSALKGPGGGGGHMEIVAQKATELGATRIVPVLTHRVEARKVKLERLRSAAIEAAEQCERVTVPSVEEPLELKKLMASWPAERKLILCDETGGVPIVEAMMSIPPGTPCAFLTGPEGGFTPEELQSIRALPACLRVSLGPNILRAETAAISAMALHHALRAPRSD